MATTTETYVPRLKQQYNDELRSQLQEQLGLSSIMQVPRVSKVTLNMGVGDVVRIVESRPLSKTKNWRLAEIVQKAR